MSVGYFAPKYFKSLLPLDSPPKGKCSKLYQTVSFRSYKSEGEILIFSQIRSSTSLITLSNVERICSGSTSYSFNNSNILVVKSCIPYHLNGYYEILPFKTYTFNFLIPSCLASLLVLTLRSNLYLPFIAPPVSSATTTPNPST
ncbi:hypothetical protein D3C81_1281900 [compost metagenome]